MPSRQDQLHSHRYARQRVVAAIVAHDPDPQRSPLRRSGVTVLAGTVVASLAVTAAAIYGFVTGGTGSLGDPSESVVYVEKKTGARYVYLAADGKLHPVLNLASALLLAGADTPQLERVSADGLAELPLGDPLGIPGAPDSLPGPKALLANLWTICTAPARSASGDAAPESVLAIGEEATGGTVLPVPAADTPAADLRGLLVADPTGRAYLIYDNRRLLLPDQRAQQIRVRLRWSLEPLRVAEAWLNAVPPGPDLVPPAIDGRGADADGMRVGQLLHVEGADERWGVVLRDGVADITVVQASLLQADEPSAGVRSLSLDEFAGLQRSAERLAGDLPPAVPTLLNGPARACLSHAGGENGRVTVRIGANVPEGVAVVGEPAVPGGVRADRIRVPRGRGAVVAAQSSPTAPASSGTVSVITDTGLRYSLAGRDLLGKLGFSGVSPQVVPARLVALLPQGPALDPVQARKTP